MRSHSPQKFRQFSLFSNETVRVHNLTNHTPAQVPAPGGHINHKSVNMSVQQSIEDESRWVRVCDTCGFNVKYVGMEKTSSDNCPCLVGSYPRGDVNP